MGNVTDVGHKNKFFASMQPISVVTPQKKQIEMQPKLNF